MTLPLTWIFGLSWKAATQIWLSWKGRINRSKQTYFRLPVVRFDPRNSWNLWIDVMSDNCLFQKLKLMRCGIFKSNRLIRNMCTMVYTYLSRSSLSSSLFIKPGLSKSRKLLFLLVLSRKWLSSFICNHKHADKLICLTFTIRNLNIYHGFKYRPIRTIPYRVLRNPYDINPIISPISGQTLANIDGWYWEYWY